jgi:hypothetical protein
MNYEEKNGAGSSDPGNGQQGIRGHGEKGRPGAGEGSIGEAPERDREEGRGSALEQAGVYFILTADEQFVKIGYSARVVRRLGQIQVIGPGTKDARLLGYMPGSFSTERWLHQKFSNFRDSGEWFRYSDEVRTFVESLGLPLTAIPLKAKPGRRRAPEMFSPPDELRAEQALRAIVKRKVSNEVSNEVPKEIPKEVPKEILEFLRRQGAKGGKQSAKGRMEKLTPVQRSELARKAANARWKGHEKKGEKKP